VSDKHSSASTVAKVPFTMYDVFGYLVPGASMIASLLFIHDLVSVFELIFFHGSGDYIADAMPHFIETLSATYKEAPVVSSAMAVFISYVVGHVVAVFSSFFLEKLALEKWIGYPAQTMFLLDENSLSPVKRRLRLAWGIKTYSRAYTPEFIRSFKMLYTRRFAHQADDARDLFWLSFELVSQHCPNAFLRVIHFLNMYGFSRNMSCAFLIAAIFTVPFSIRTGVFGWLVFAVYLALSVAFYLNYMKLLRRLNDEVFRSAYVFMTEPREDAERIE
jgi:hypothetical protein